MTAYRLPVSRQSVALRPPDGHDQILLAQPPMAGLDLQVAVLARLAPPEAADVRWEELPVADIDPAFLALRRELVGDRIVAEVSCATCGGKGDLTFAASGYLAAHAPAARHAAERQADGWYRCGDAFFRPPTAADVMAAARTASEAGRQAALVEQGSIRAETAHARRRARRALDKAAPLIGGPVVGACPECRAAIDGWFEPADFVLAELAQRCSGIFEQVHLLAGRYGWSETTILDLPGWRRDRYAALVAGDAAVQRRTLAH